MGRVDKGPIRRSPILNVDVTSSGILRGPYQWARYKLDLLTLKTGLCKHRAVFICIEHGVIVCLYIVLA